MYLCTYMNFVVVHGGRARAAGGAGRGAAGARSTGARAGGPKSLSPDSDEGDEGKGGGGWQLEYGAMLAADCARVSGV